MTIGERLRLIRKKYKKNLDETAALFDISAQALSRYETGKRTPDIDFLKRFSKHYKISGDWLLFGDLPILKRNDSQRDAKELFLEIAASLTITTDKKSPGPDLIDIAAEHFTGTPENFVLMLQYMLNYPEVCKNILQFFFLFQIPLADNDINTRLSCPDEEKVSTCLPTRQA